MKQVKINETTITTEQLYPYRYDYGKGKEVLRIDIMGGNHNFEEVKVLENADNQVIEYYEDGVKKNEYTGYCKDFSCQYADGKYSVEITRMTESDLKLAAVEKQLEENTEVINAMMIAQLGGEE